MGLFQKDIAALLGADEASVNNWETGKTSPSLAFLPKIVEFFGYVPCEPKRISTGEKIRISREAMGLTLKDLANGIQVDPTTLWKWEMERRQPAPKYLDRLNDFFEKATQ